MAEEKASINVTPPSQYGMSINVSTSENNQIDLVPNKQNIDITTSSPNYMPLNATPDLSMYYSEVSENWAKQAENSAERASQSAAVATDAANSILNNPEVQEVLNSLDIIEAAPENAQLAKEQADLAQGFANSAGESATIASQQATIAAEKAQEASNSAEEILTKIDAAQTAASNANTSATSALNSANLAQTYMQNAQTSASNAKTSETNAKTSETNALSYRNSAQTYANNASASATSASTSANTATAQATIATQQANIAKQEVAKLANVYNFKGSVATYADLPTNANIGDVYDVQENGANYAWTGSEWDSLGGVFKTTTEWGELQGTLSNQTDLKSALDNKQDKGNYALKSEIPNISNLATKAEVQIKQDALTAGENITIEGNVISAIVNEVDAYTKSEIDVLLDGKQDTFSTETPLELKTTINSTQNKLQYVDGVVTVQNAFQCVTQDNLGYSSPTQNKAYGIPRYIISCTVGTNGGSGKNITVSKNGDLNYISYPFTLQPNKEIIFPINYMLGYFDDEDVFNLVIRTDSAPYSNSSYYYVPLIANNATGHRWDTSTTNAFSMLCLCNFGSKKPLSKQEAELIAYSLSCTSLTVGATLTLKLYYNYRTTSEAVTLKTITLTENMVSALSKVSVAIAPPYSFTSVYPSNTYVQAPITDGDGNVLFNTGGEDIITRGLLLNHDSTLRVVGGALSANLDDYALKSEIPDTTDFVTTSTLEGQLTLKADKSDTYSKAEVDDKIADAVTGGEIDLSGYAKTTDVDNKLSLKADKTEIPNISNLATKAEVNAKQDKGDYALKSELPNTSSFITMADVEAKKYLTSVPSEYVTETELNAKGYLTQHQDISNLATKVEVQTKQDKLTAGENITIEDGVISAEGGVSIDNNSITENSLGEIQAVAVIDNNTSNAIRTWTGTRAEYDAIATKDSTTLYNITDDNNVTLSLLEILYPVGAVYIGTMATCPLQVLGVGNWQLIASDRVLQGAGTYNVKSAVEAGLPNIEASWRFYHAAAVNCEVSGAVTLTEGGADQYTGTSSNNRNCGVFNLDASLASPIYGNSETVQPPAYIVNIWERIS